MGKAKLKVQKYKTQSYSTHLRWSKAFEILKTFFDKLFFFVNAYERKITFIYPNQMVKAVKSKSKSCWNHLKQIKPLNKIMLRFSRKQPVDLSKQPVESVWQQSQNKAKLFQTTKCQTIVESTFQQVEISHPSRKFIF